MSSDTQKIFPLSARLRKGARQLKCVVGVVLAAWVISFAVTFFIALRVNRWRAKLTATDTVFLLKAVLQNTPEQDLERKMTAWVNTYMGYVHHNKTSRPDHFIILYDWVKESNDALPNYTIVYLSDPKDPLATIEPAELTQHPGSARRLVMTANGKQYTLVVVDRPASVFSRYGGNLQYVWLIFLLIGLGVIAATWLLIDRYIIPVKEATDEIKSLAQGNLPDKTLQPYGTQHAMTLTTAVNDMIARRRNLVEATGRLAAWDLTSVESDEYLTGALGSSIRAMASRIRELVDEIRHVGTQVASASSEILSVSENMEKGIQHQADQSAHVTSSAEDIATSVIEIAQNSRNVLQNSREAMSSSVSAMDAAKEGGSVVQKTISRMKQLMHSVKEASGSVAKLGKRSEDIGQIIETIDDIADQTNMLALNAAIEAARAGEHGLSFGVVADEIRRLADQTADATKQVADLIESIQEHTASMVEQMEAWTNEVSEATDLSGAAGIALEEILKRNNEVQEMVHQTVAATEEQTKASDEMSRNIEAIGRAIDSISLLAQESSTGATEVRNSANDLTKLTETMVRLIEKFKT